MRDRSAYPIAMERIGDFTGGNEADNAHAASLMRRPQFVQDDAEVPGALRDHLIRDFGPTPAKNGGDMLLTVGGSADLAKVIAMLNYLG